MKKIFILGASSDIGINVTELFLKSGWHVTAHYNNSNKKLTYLKSKFKEIDVIKFDLVDPDFTEEVSLSNYGASPYVTGKELSKGQELIF